ncbi:hypothetical protein B0H21DRAFT_579270 [Amylocystis lapponica]|nr:hypothetical protein B0H21DRAFT_579270 [Amylocystis lapponica]
MTSLRWGKWRICGHCWSPLTQEYPDVFLYKTSVVLRSPTISVPQSTQSLKTLNMPLFGKKHNTEEPRGADAAQGRPYNDQLDNSTAGANTHDYDAGAGAHHGHGHHDRNAPLPPTGSAGYTDQRYGTHNTGADHATNPNVPPASHLNDGQGAGGRRFEGKTEHALGSLVGSQALKNKGMQKEHEAGAFKAQSDEIAEAERLEQEALVRRERAVAHGAHPDNGYLGGGHGAGGNASGGRGGAF